MLKITPFNGMVYRHIRLSGDANKIVKLLMVELLDSILGRGLLNKHSEKLLSKYLKEDINKCYNLM